MRPADIVSAGAVISRDGTQILLVHRPRYDDWSFPKGKLDAGEHPVTAAVREVAEETGLDVRLGPPLDTQRYTVTGGARDSDRDSDRDRGGDRGGDRGRTKDVHYWAARVVGDDDVTAYEPNAEIDDLAWLPYDDAMERLTYPYDRATLAEFGRSRRTTRVLVVLRHAQALSRKTWPGDDRLRTLSAAGQLQAERLVPLLAAYDLRHIVTSSSVRCVQTVQPYAHVSGVEPQALDALSEEDAEPGALDAVAEQLLSTRAGTLVCSHRPVLPPLFEALGVDAIKLKPAGLAVVHHRAGQVVAVEHHTLDR